eukprot:CAMPEP_0204822056 /NCGR_PEP_ID=MMETSP1346-20131115/238_1 /ASSEMBLY_ACC=CAM_ASM_000771 /TAXON_ID=215587 /ORGANISM="Aplanochytrium stocchinoi, Strain GSBS06" /LENGTH=387 /DNA_ID=CAMNT_0051948071 /DNA_START=1643 /DNA_END=2803 /DNA_ORIENTATION=-
MALQGIKVVEIAGLAPAPFAGLCLADFGASVVRVDRSKNGATITNMDTLSRGKRSIALDLKSEEGQKVFKILISKSDVLIEPFRPGVMERLGLGPDVLLALNPRLIYARMTGFGQGGDPDVSKAAGHDTNYIALSGVLSALRSAGQKPQPPANLLGDFGGGGLICAFGILLALMERQNSGKGQVVDAAMVDGAAYLASAIFSGNSVGAWSNDLDTVGTNLLDGGAHFYQTYECKDGKFMSLGAIEPQFYAELLKGMGLDEKQDNLPNRMDSSQWPQMKERFARIFLTKPRDEWAEIFKGKDACAFPILSLQEAIANKHNVARGTFVKKEGSIDTHEPAAAPKLSRTPAHGSRPMPVPGSHTLEILTEFGFSTDQIQSMLKSKNVVAD